MEYELTAAGILNRLGYRESTGAEWLEDLKRDRRLPEVYTAFLELTADTPLLGTSDLWTGKMSHGVCVPGTYYDELREAIEDRKDRWPKRPGKYEKALYALSQLPAVDWPEQAEDYLLIGSDYAGGMGTFGIRMQDLTEKDPPVYWKKNSGSLTDWKPENETLSDFLLGVLTEALACIDYQTAEYALEERGWRYEEYFDVKKRDWTASKAVLKRYGINYGELKRHRGNSGTVFCCWDETRNVLFVGGTEDGELSLCAVSRKDAGNVFPDPDSLECLLEDARLCVKDREREDEISRYDVYTKTPGRSVCLSDVCYLEDPLKEGETSPAPPKDGMLYALCSGKFLMEVVEKALQKKPKAGPAELAAALNEALNSR